MFEVDAIVVASTSICLCHSIVEAAGTLLSRHYQIQMRKNFGSLECDGGALPWKEIIFRPWTGNLSALDQVKQSVETFVSSALDCALKNGFTTIGKSLFN